MDSLYKLTGREMEICGLIAKGMSNEQIAGTLFLSEGTVKNYITSIYEKTGVNNRAQLAVSYVMKYAHSETDIFDSQESADVPEQTAPKLRLIGQPGLPDVIRIALKGRPFVIGRFDVSVGRKQCDFEFDKDTKAVSRRHATIARSDDGTVIVDQNSRAGTFVNGEKIAPSKAYQIRHGDHISFGGMGADYIYED